MCSAFHLSASYYDGQTGSAAPPCVRRRGRAGIIEETFLQIAAILLIATVLGALFTRFRQPLIVAFIAVGVLVGPVGLGWVQAGGEIVLLADLGIAILLFLVGLKLDLHLIRTTGKVALVTGLGQVLFTSLVGYALARVLGLAHLPALYVAVALTFSSTIIIVKLLSDKRELDEPHGRIAVGFLIVQDIVVVIVMVALSAVVGQGQALGPALAMVLLKGLAALAVILVVVRYVFPRLLPALAGSPELLILAAIAWAVLLAAGGEALGFSREVGAFVAGVSLASTAYREAIGARLVSLRDFLLVFFFIDLGARVQLDDAGGQLLAAVVLSAFVLIGNPLIVMILMGVMGYRRRVGFLAGLTVAQISEFSLILAALGLTLGHIDSQTVSLITVVGLITIGLSTYLILYSYPLYDRLAPHLGLFERRSLRAERIEVPPEVNVVIFGAGRYGSRLTTELAASGLRILVVDHDPQALARLPHTRVETLYGDAEEPELALALPMTSAGCVVSTIPNRDVSLSLLHGIRAAGFTGPFLATAHNPLDTRLLLAAGVQVVLDPYAVAAEHSTDLIRTLATDTV